MIRATRHGRAVMKAMHTYDKILYSSQRSVIKYYLHQAKAFVFIHRLSIKMCEKVCKLVRHVFQFMRCDWQVWQSKQWHSVLLASQCLQLVYYFVYDLFNGLDRWRQYGWNWTVLFTSFKTWLQNRRLGYQARDAGRCFCVLLQQGPEYGLQYVVANTNFLASFSEFVDSSFAYVHEHSKMFFSSRLSLNSYEDHLASATC